MRGKHARTWTILPKNFSFDHFLNDEHRQYLQYFQANPTIMYQSWTANITFVYNFYLIPSFFCRTHFDDSKPSWGKKFEVYTKSKVRGFDGTWFIQRIYRPCQKKKFQRVFEVQSWRLLLHSANSKGVRQHANCSASVIELSMTHSPLTQGCLLAMIQLPRKCTVFTDSAFTRINSSSYFLLSRRQLSLNSTSTNVANRLPHCTGINDQDHQLGVGRMYSQGEECISFNQIADYMDVAAI